MQCCCIWKDHSRLFNVAALPLCLYCCISHTNVCCRRSGKQSHTNSLSLKAFSSLQWKQTKSRHLAASPCARQLTDIFICTCSSVLSDSDTLSACWSSNQWASSPCCNSFTDHMEIFVLSTDCSSLSFALSQDVLLSLPLHLAPSLSW